MKKKIIKHLIELFFMLLIYLAVTIIMSLIFKRNGFTSMSFVYVIMLVISKLIITIYDCAKKDNA